MTKKILFQGIALINFLFLMAIFIFYKNGSLDKFLFGKKDNYITSPNGGTATKTTKDSLKIKADSVETKRTWLSTSKSIVITDNLQMNIDTTLPKDSVKIKNEEKERMLMFGSKSSYFIKEIKLFDTIKLNNDSLKPKIKK